VRTVLASALLLLVCGVASGCADRSSRPEGAGAPLSIPSGPDPLLLRVPQKGGVLAVTRYPALDSVVWRSNGRVPPLSRFIGFGPEDGYLSAVDTGGAPVRVDLRIGSVSIARAETLSTLASFDGGAIYGLTASGEITRFTPSGGDWKFRPSLPVQALYPQADGSLIVAGARGDQAIVWRVRPPQTVVSDSVVFDIGGDEAALRNEILTTAGAVGDRVFFGANERVIAVRARDLGPALNVDVGDPVQAIAATPSGDRLFVAPAEDDVLRIVDRFEEGVTGNIRLPAPARALRMDPLGRVLLARGAQVSPGVDSVFVVSLADDAVIGVIESAWRGDLPLVLPDGGIAVTQGSDVVFAHPSTLAPMQTVKDGASSWWHTLRWNGFRPRAAGLDQPVQFRTSAPRDPSDLPPAGDSTGAVVGGGAGSSSDSTTGAAAAGADAPPRVSQFTVSFAAILDEKQARALASRIRVDGQSPRVTTSERDGKLLYRVIMGPYPTRAEAERVGKASGQSYWVFEGAP
jgi:hypothetical protein